MKRRGCENREKSMERKAMRDNKMMDEDKEHVEMTGMRIWL